MLFSTTYLCEAGSSALTQLKSKNRNKLSVEHDLLIALSSGTPNVDSPKFLIKKLITGKLIILLLIFTHGYLPFLPKKKRVIKETITMFALNCQIVAGIMNMKKGTHFTIGWYAGMIKLLSGVQKKEKKKRVERFSS